MAIGGSAFWPFSKAFCHLQAVSKAFFGLVGHDTYTVSRKSAKPIWLWHVSNIFLENYLAISFSDFPDFPRVFCWNFKLEWVSDEKTWEDTGQEQKKKRCVVHDKALTKLVHVSSLMRHSNEKKAQTILLRKRNATAVELRPFSTGGHCLEDLWHRIDTHWEKCCYEVQCLKITHMVSST